MHRIALSLIVIVIVALGACRPSVRFAGGERVPAAASVPSPVAVDDTPCIIDPSDNIAKQCHHVMADGKCAHFGTQCPGMVQPLSGSTPPSSSTSGTCMVDPSTNSRRTCFHVTAGGGCAHFGGPC